MHLKGVLDRVEKHLQKKRAILEAEMFRYHPDQNHHSFGILYKWAAELKLNWDDPLGQNAIVL